MMNEQEKMRARANHAAMKDIAEGLMHMLEGKAKIQIGIMLKADEISTELMRFGEEYASPDRSEDFSEEQLESVLEYLGLVQTGLRQFADSQKKGETADA